jgi:putative (di)nucleoside polyphosphate hydrolase
MIDYEDRPYRPCVGIVLRNDDNHIFVGQRINNLVEAWQMPQGGIDDGETALEAGFREMQEEVGTNKATFIAEHSSWLNYDIPVDLANQLWKGRFRGQTQKWILFNFDGTDENINIKTEDPEFCSWKWAEPKVIPDLAVPFKRNVYLAVLEEFRDKL